MAASLQGCSRSRAGQGSDQLPASPAGERDSRRAFTLIEMVGVLAVIVVLASMLVPVVIRRLNFAAWSGESASLSAMADALRLYIVRSNSIPDQTTWFSAVGSQLGMAPGSITTTPRNYTRAFLIDKGGWLNTALASGPWYQSPGGTAVAPTGCRLMIVSTIAGPTPLPFSSANQPSAADFNTLWITPQGTTPNLSAFTTWTNNGGNPGNLVIQRISLDLLFHHVILVNGSIGGQGYFSINTNTTTPAPVPPGGSGTNTYYLDGSVLGLYDTNSNLVAQEIIKRDLSRVFEYGLWRDQLYLGTTNGFLVGLDYFAATFFTSPVPPNAPPGATTQGVLALMASYMEGYMSWAGTSPQCFSYSGTNYANGSFAPYNETIGALNSMNSAGVVP